MIVLAWSNSCSRGEERRYSIIDPVKYAPWLTLSGSGILLGVETTSRGGGDDTNQANNNANITDVLAYLHIYIDSNIYSLLS